MLQKLPAGVGRVLAGVRSGFDKLAIYRAEFALVPDTISVTSPAFEDGAAIPAVYTADTPGEPLSPPLEWRGVPPAAVSLVLLVEDADSPTPKPLVHAIAWNLPPADDLLPEGALPSDASVKRMTRMGQNSALKPQYLAPDPPPGHGRHRYVFQVFALDTILHFDQAPGRQQLLSAMEGRVLAKGSLMGTYVRG